MSIEELKTIFLRWSSAPEWIYLTVASIAVLSFVFITPPFQGPDEEAHYIRIQYIAHGYFIPMNIKGSDTSLPKSIPDTIYKTFYEDDLRGDSNNKYESFRTKDILDTPFNSGGNYQPPMITYSPVPYIPAVPGVYIANLLNLSPIISMYVARLSLAITSILLIFFAIKIIPQNKYLVLAVGLIPMLLFQQSVISADSVSYSLLFITIAYIVYLRSCPVIRKKQWLAMAGLSLLVTLSKPPLYLFLPLILLIANKKNSYKWIAVIAFICMLALFGWMKVGSAVTETVPVYGTPENVNSSEQMDVLKNPKRALRIAWNSYMTQFGDDEVRGVIGVFGAADTVYPIWMFTLYVVVLCLLCIVNLDANATNTKVKRRWKILVLVLCFMYFAAVNIALYLSYTPVNFDVVYGVQGRYFLPVLIAAAMLLFTGGLQLNTSDRRKVKKYSVALIVFLIFLALLITYQRYYMYTP